MAGPLAGIRIVEMAGIGPGPFTAMMLADLGADVIRIERAGQVTGGDPENPPQDFLNRSRRSIGVDLKSPEGVAVAIDLIAKADGLIEGFRPGVMERLGLGPDVCLERNPRLVYGRMTGWGQEGPYASMAGHDINYIALSGVLAHLGRSGDAPTPPINLVGDFGGGGMLLAFGLVAGLLSAAKTGEGQVIDAAMVDGSALLMTMIWSFQEMGFWTPERGSNILDTGAHFYDTYRCSDGEWVSFGAIEPQFYAEFLRLLDISADGLPHQQDRTGWAEMKEKVRAVVATRSRDEWCAVFDGTDACFAPVLTMREATQHPHNVQRGTFVENAGRMQPAPAPRFSKTPGEISRPPCHTGQHSAEILGDWLGLDDERIATVFESGVVR